MNQIKYHSHTKEELTKVRVNQSVAIKFNFVINIKCKFNLKYPERNLLPHML